jgi:hypothetical protein
MRSIRVLVLAGAALCAACSSSPTEPSTAVLQGARHNGGGWTIGSGVVPSDTTQPAGTASAGEDEGAGDTASRGGWTIGSGN